MRWLTLLVVIAVAYPAVAADLGARKPDESATSTLPPPPDPVVLRQGGDTIADAVPITLPHWGSGTTVGYTDDYDEVCPYTQSTSPDVVYRFSTSAGYNVVVDLYGSTYDTKVYVYDQDLQLMGCNDDHYPNYVSYLEVPLPAGTYDLVIDGYGGDAGQYVLSLDTLGPPWFVCPDGAAEEGEPPLADDQVDAYNGGCDSLADVGAVNLQPLVDPVFCGQGGWFRCGDDVCRDRDWFTVTLPASGTLTITGEAIWTTVIQELAPTDCGQAVVVQSVEFGPFDAQEITLTGAPGSTVWLRVMATHPEGPGAYPFEYLYILELPQVVSIQQRSWSGIKGLYDH